MKLKLHVFADGRCVLSTEEPLAREQVEMLRQYWADWVLSREAHPILIINGVVAFYDVTIGDSALTIEPSP